MINTVSSNEVKNSIQSEQYIIVKYMIHGIYRELKIAKKEILYFESTKSRRIILKTYDKEYELLVKPLTYYEKLINSNEFAIFIRNYLINLTHIKLMDHDYFTLENNIKLSLGSDNRTKKMSKEKYIKYLSDSHSQ